MLHARAFKATVVWTLILLYLGSVVHATGSSLACPDWPTCFGTMVPEMTGGVFWEHLHRLVAGGLLLMWGLATWLAYRETEDRPWIFRASLAGLALLLAQSVLGGLTVLYRLPDAVSTTHLALAFAFLAMSTVLASQTSNAAIEESARPADASVRAWAGVTAGLVFVQSVLGALVRHMDAGMACPDVPLCVGRIVPPLSSAPIAVHFFHRVLALLVACAVVAFAIHTRRAGAPRRIRRWALVAVVLVVTQIALGVASVLTFLAVIPDSLHTLVAASLLAVLVHVATSAHRATRHAPEPALASAA